MTGTAPPAASEGKRLEALANLLVDAFKREDLEHLFLVTIGEDLYRSYVPRGQTDLKTAFDLVQKLDSRGETPMFLAAVVKARVTNAAVRDVIGQYCPEALVQQASTKVSVNDVIASVQAARAQLADPEVRRVIAESREDLLRVSRDIDVLALYKTLHDCLHKIQLKHYRQVADAARHFRTEPTALDTMMSYVAELLTIAADARKAAEALPDMPGARGLELRWVTDLDGIVAGLQSGIDNQDDVAAVEAARKLKHVLRYHPVRVNELLAVTAAGLPLARLIEALEQIIATTAGSKGDEFSTGLAGLRRVCPTLLGRVEEHRAWQEVERDIWEADDSMYQGTVEAIDGIVSLWPSLRGRIVKLCDTEAAAPWAKQLLQYIKKFDETVGAAPRTEHWLAARPSFASIRIYAMHRFYTVDLDLKSMCGEITAIGDPLRSLLEQLEVYHD